MLLLVLLPIVWPLVNIAPYQFKCIAINLHWGMAANACSGCQGPHGPGWQNGNNLFFLMRQGRSTSGITELWPVIPALNWRKSCVHLTSKRVMTSASPMAAEADNRFISQFVTPKYRGIHGSIKYCLVRDLPVCFNRKLRIADHYLRPLSELYIYI